MPKFAQMTTLLDPKGPKCPESRWLKKSKKTSPTCNSGDDSSLRGGLSVRHPGLAIELSGELFRTREKAIHPGPNSGRFCHKH